jgi:hypothetical protein
MEQQRYGTLKMLSGCTLLKIKGKIWRAVRDHFRNWVDVHLRPMGYGGQPSLVILK